MSARKLRALIREELALALASLKPKPIKMTVEGKLTEPYVSALRAAAAKTRQVADQSARADLEARVTELERHVLGHGDSSNRDAVTRVNDGSSIKDVIDRIEARGHRDHPVTQRSAEVCEQSELLVDVERCACDVARAVLSLELGCGVVKADCKCAHCGKQVVLDGHGSPLNDDPTVGGAL